ncbi:glycoside hydrolase family 31 protein [Pseudoscourfieldia marina]
MAPLTYNWCEGGRVPTRQSRIAPLRPRVTCSDPAASSKRSTSSCDKRRHHALRAESHKSNRQTANSASVSAPPTSTSQTNNTATTSDDATNAPAATAAAAAALDLTTTTATATATTTTQQQVKSTWTRVKSRAPTLSLTSGAVVCVVYPDGVLELSDGRASERRPRVHLSLGANALAHNPVRWNANDNKIVVEWVCGSTLEVTRPPNHEEAAVSEKDWWLRGRKNAVLVNFRVPSTAEPVPSPDFQPYPDEGPHAPRAAEVSVELDQGGSWYGGAHLMRQHWPLEEGRWEVGPHLPFDNGPHGIGMLVGCHWVSSHGVCVAVDPESRGLHAGLNAPLRSRPGRAVPGSTLDGYRGGREEDPWPRRAWGVGVQNCGRPLLPLGDIAQDAGDRMLRLQSRLGWEDDGVVHPWCRVAPRDDDGTASLRVCLSVSPDVREATTSALAPMPRPGRSPPDKIMQHPIWCTWARDHSGVTQDSVMTYARQIAERGLPRSAMEIDDRWQQRYGDIHFCPSKFPTAKEMVDELHDLGFKVTLWVTPFAEAASETYREGAALGYYVTSHSATPASEEFELGISLPGTALKFAVDLFQNLENGMFRWWGTQPVAALDLTNPKAVRWFLAKLRKLQEETGVDGFKFDAGEPCFLPSRANTHAELAHPAEYTRLWVTEVARHFEWAEVRCGWPGTSGTHLLTRMGDKDSMWGIGNGLRALVPQLLTAGVLGYPFCLPDMVGGNCYWGQSPSEELMVRWAQTSSLMPAVQFSLPPWRVSERAAGLCAESLAIRGRFAREIARIAKDSAVSLEPMCRPMWWLDPHDTSSFSVNDQYSLGNDVVVAPVVERGAKSRSVYLPHGLWRELPTWECRVGDDRCVESPLVVHEGRQTFQVDAPLAKLPVFVRVGSRVEAELGLTSAAAMRGN